MLFFIVFLAKYLFFNWSYSTTGFELIIFLCFQKECEYIFFRFKKGAGGLIQKPLPKKLFHNIGGIQIGCDINFCAVRLR